MYNLKLLINIYYYLLLLIQCIYFNIYILFQLFNIYYSCFVSYCITFINTFIIVSDVPRAFVLCL